METTDYMDDIILVQDGGEGGIRTHGTRKGSTVFETARFNRSRTSPDWACGLIIPNRPRLFGIADLTANILVSYPNDFDPELRRFGDSGRLLALRRLRPSAPDPHAFHRSEERR